MKSGEKLEKVGGNGEKVGKSGGKLGIVGKGGVKWFFYSFFNKMAAGGHFGCPKITFDHSSCHFRLDKMAASGHFGLDDNVSYRTRPRYLDD